MTLCSCRLPSHVTEMPVSDCLIQGPKGNAVMRLEPVLFVWATSCISGWSNGCSLSKYRYALHNDVSVNDGPQIWRWSHKNITLSSLGRGHSAVLKVKYKNEIKRVHRLSHASFYFLFYFYYFKKIKQKYSCDRRSTYFISF